jgi:hypothetical protein
MRGIKLNSKAKQASSRHTRHIKYSQLSPRFVSVRLSNTWGCGSEGERLTGSQKVVGSSPTSSILSFQRPARASSIWGGTRDE